MNQPNTIRPDRSESGASLFAVTMLVSVLATLSLSMVMVNTSVVSEHESGKRQVASVLAAESGVADAVFALNNGGTGDIASMANPVEHAGAQYWVDATDLGGGLVALVSTGIDAQHGSRVEVTMQEVKNNIWTWGAFGDEELTMDSNSHVDSYDSTLGDWASQAVNSSGNGTYANQNGNVGSNGDVSIDQNSEVHGDAVSGPTATTSVLGNATVSGSTTPAGSPQALPALVIPSFPSSGPLSVSGSQTLASGNYYFSSVTFGGNSELTVTGPATIVVDDYVMKSNTTFWVDATNGPVELYVIDDFILNSNTLMASTTYDPADLEINLESDNVINPTVNVQVSEVNFESNAQLYGTVFAPNATIDIDSNFELFGAVVARQVHLSSWSRVHFDENLMTAKADQNSTWQALCWRTVAYHPSNMNQGAGGQNYP